MILRFVRWVLFMVLCFIVIALLSAILGDWAWMMMLDPRRCCMF